MFVEIFASSEAPLPNNILHFKQNISIFDIIVKATAVEFVCNPWVNQEYFKVTENFEIQKNIKFYILIAITFCKGFQTKKTTNFPNANIVLKIFQLKYLAEVNKRVGGFISNGFFSKQIFTRSCLQVITDDHGWG